MLNNWNNLLYLPMVNVASVCNATTEILIIVKNTKVQSYDKSIHC